MFKISDVPWQIAVLVIALLFFVSLVLGLFGVSFESPGGAYKLTTGYWGASVSEEEAARLFCGIKNPVHNNFSQAVSMTFSNACSAVCANVNEDNKTCFANVLIDQNGRMQHGGCDLKISEKYFESGSKAFCCCY